MNFTLVVYKKKSDCICIVPTAYQSARYGAGSGPIHLDDVECHGNESSLQQCNHSGVRNHDCGHYEDASVSCFNGMAIIGVLPDTDSHMHHIILKSFQAVGL